MKVTLTNFESNIVLKYNCSFFYRRHIVSFHIVDCIDKFPASCISVDWDCFRSCTMWSGLLCFRAVSDQHCYQHCGYRLHRRLPGWVDYWLDGGWTFSTNLHLVSHPDCCKLHCVPKKLWSRTLAITLSNFNRFQKFLHCCKEKEIYNKPCVTIPPHLRYVATLPCEIQQFETDTNYTQNTIKCPHIYVWHNWKHCPFNKLLT